MIANIILATNDEAGELVPIPVPVINVGTFSFKRRIAEALADSPVIELPGLDVSRLTVARLSRGLAGYAFGPVSFSSGPNTHKPTAAERAMRTGSLTNIADSQCLFAMVARSAAVMAIAVHARAHHIIAHELADLPQESKDSFIAMLEAQHRRMEVQAMFDRVPFPTLEELNEALVKGSEL